MNKVYKIPAQINRTFLDMEIPFGKGYGTKFIPLKIVLFYVCAGLFAVWFMVNSFMAQANILAQILFVLSYAGFMGFMGWYSKTKEMNFMKIPVFFEFFPKTSRRIRTRSSDNPHGFYKLVGIKSIGEHGEIFYNDGSIGKAFLVAGSASVLTFDEDLRAMVNSVASFYQRLDTATELITMTTKEPQRVYHQIAHLEKQNRALKNRDPELVALMNEKYTVLHERVGRDFKSIHQYFIVKSNSIEELNTACTALLRHELEKSSAMLQSCTDLQRDDVIEMLSVMYQGRQF